MRRSLRSAFVLGVLAGLIVALLRTLTREARPVPAPLAAPPPPLPAVTPPVRTPVPVAVATPEPTDGPPPAPAPGPVIGSDGFPSDPITGSEEQSWVAPVEGACPDGYPIKAKVSSGIYHRPGGLSYERTRPDRCYPSESVAESDGFRAAKR